LFFDSAARRMHSGLRSLKVDMAAGIPKARHRRDYPMLGRFSVPIRKARGLLPDCRSLARNAPRPVNPGTHQALLLADPLETDQQEGYPQTCEPSQKVKARHLPLGSQKLKELDNNTISGVWLEQFSLLFVLY
jgi:hypothetical protein